MWLQWGTNDPTGNNRQDRVRISERIADKDDYIRRVHGDQCSDPVG